jgi:hypothetical protein
VQGCSGVQRWWDEEGKVSSGSCEQRQYEPVAWLARGGSSDTRRRHQRRAGAVGRQQRGQNSAGSVRGRKAPGRFETDSVGTVALGRAQLGAQCCFSNYSNFARISKYKTKTIPMSKVIETWHGVRVDHSKELLPLGTLPILNTIQVIKLGTTSTLNFSLNF